MNQEETNNPLVEVIQEALLELKAENIIRLDLREITTLTDYFFVCEASTDTQIRAITQHVIERVRDTIDERVWKKEGTQSLNWVILDYVNVVVHVLDRESRAFYNIEGMWNDAPSIVIKDEKP